MTTTETTMTTDEKANLRQLVLDLEPLMSRFPQSERGDMWRTVMTALALDMGRAYRGAPPSDWFDKVAGVALLDVETTMSTVPTGPVMATTTTGEA